MDVGVIGLGTVGRAIVEHLLGKTARNLFVYDPDGRGCGWSVTGCATAAELCEKCGVVFLALESASDLTALCGGISRYIQPEQIFVDLTDTSPALAHSVANGMRRRNAYYIDCGLFGEGLEDKFILFAGGNSEAFAAVQPMIRCFAPDCRYMGPSGRGKAVRLFCRALSAQLQDSIYEISQLASSFGIDEAYFLESLGMFEQIARPLAVLEGGKPLLEREALSEDVAVVAEMARRAHLDLGGLFASEDYNHQI